MMIKERRRGEKHEREAQSSEWKERGGRSLDVGDGGEGDKGVELEVEVSGEEGGGREGDEAELEGKVVGPLEDVVEGGRGGAGDLAVHSASVVVGVESGGTEGEDGGDGTRGADGHHRPLGRLVQQSWGHAVQPTSHHLHRRHRVLAVVHHHLRRLVLAKIKHKQHDVEGLEGVLVTREEVELVGAGGEVGPEDVDEGVLDEGGGGGGEGGPVEEEEEGLEHVVSVLGEDARHDEGGGQGGSGGERGPLAEGRRGLDRHRRLHRSRRGVQAEEGGGSSVTQTLLVRPSHIVHLASV
mmetsp:Transcript_24282/g.39897  ORF Transcript_24282/g.39897 Transcript_24282/m.39897 type:complete len:296 (+) Transcript_24282:33-920(+)